MSTIGWRFRKIEDGQKAQNPTHREHLKDVVQSLVRETIQNSLDATWRPDESSDAPVTKVFFTFGTAACADAKPFLDGLTPHLSATRDILPEGLPTDFSTIPFLSIEDFGTRGLVGDPNRFAENLPTPINGDKKNHFYHFWHAVGQSPGEHKRRGSWGVGKVVFSNASAIRSFFGLTRFHGCPVSLLMGECGLRVHEIAGDAGRYDWYGYFAEHRGTGATTRPYPVSDPPTLSAFQSLFKLARSMESGLSLVVPFLRKEFTAAELARFTIENFFYAISAGRLEVLIKSERDQFHLTKSHLLEVVDNLEWPARNNGGKVEVRKLLELARWHQQLSPTTDLLILKSPTTYNIDRDQWPVDSLKDSAERFSKGEAVALRVVVPVKETNGQQREDSLDLVLQRDDALRKSNVVHMRAGLTLPDLREKAGPGARGLLLVGIDERSEQGPLDKLLQKSEGPAHRNWETSGEHYDQAKNTYDNAHILIRFCRGLAARVRELLTTPNESRDLQTLRDFFPDPSKPKARDETPPVVVEPPPVVPPLPPPLPKMFTREDVDDGFVIRGNPEFAGQLCPLRIRMAYATWGGGHWSRYRPSDFDLTDQDQLALKAVGILEDRQGMVRKPNVLSITPIDPKFRIEVRGFDRNRALYVDVRPVEQGREEDET